MSRLKVKVQQRSEQGTANVGIRLVALDGALLPSFEAGAHVDIFLPGGLVRQYSIASSPTQPDHYQLCIKLEPCSRGGSSFIHSQLQEGDELEISTPRNLFALREGRRHVLIAAGIGITPLLSMAEALHSRGEAFALHYYTRHAADVAFGERLRGHLTGAVHFHHSSEGRSPRDHLPEELAAPQAGTQLYLCGPSAFMSDLQQRATALGWAPEVIHKEAFSAGELPALTEGEAFEVQLGSTGAVYNVAPAQSIAQALMEAGVEVPLSCEQGICGACVTGVLDGQPLHLDSVLSAAEQAGNRVMTLCCSRSRSARLVLDL